MFYHRACFLEFQSASQLVHYTTYLFMGWRRRFCDACSDHSFYYLYLLIISLGDIASYLIPFPSHGLLLHQCQRIYHHMQDGDK